MKLVSLWIFTLSTRSNFSNVKKVLRRILLCNYSAGLEWWHIQRFLTSEGVPSSHPNSYLEWIGLIWSRTDGRHVFGRPGVLFILNHRFTPHVKLRSCSPWTDVWETTAGWLFSPPAVCLLPLSGHLGWRLPEAECSSRRWAPSPRWEHLLTWCWSPVPRGLWGDTERSLRVGFGLVWRQRQPL